MTPTVGPMPCQGCGCRVWWRDRVFYVHGSPGGWKRHNCKDAIVGRASSPRVLTDDERRAYSRDWMRRKRKEQRDVLAETRRQLPVP